MMEHYVACLSFTIVVTSAQDLWPGLSLNQSPLLRDQDSESVETEWKKLTDRKKPKAKHRDATEWKQSDQPFSSIPASSFILDEPSSASRKHDYYQRGLFEYLQSIGNPVERTDKMIVRAACELLAYAREAPVRKTLLALCDELLDVPTSVEMRQRSDLCECPPRKHTPLQPSYLLPYTRELFEPQPKLSRYDSESSDESRWSGPSNLRLLLPKPYYKRQYSRQSKEVPRHYETKKKRLSPWSRKNFMPLGENAAVVSRYFHNIWRTKRRV